MRFYILRDWLLKQLSVSKRLQRVALWYLISIMIITRKHSLDHAASISGKGKSQFSKLLRDHSDRAVLTLSDLSRKEARRWSAALSTLKGLPWRVAVIIDLTDQLRASLHPENSKKLNHGKGYFIGHQWTNVVLLMGERIIPLAPIAFFSRNYCRDKLIPYKTEHSRVVDYLKALDLSAYIEGYRPEDVVVLADSGYDDQRIERTIQDKGWDFVMALKRTRSVKSNTEHLLTSPTEGWRQIQDLFKAHRRLKWQTIRLFSNGTKRKRKDFRIRHTLGWVKNVGPAQLVCSERKNAPRGERKHFACTHLTVTSRQILLAYSLRWSVELFHKAIKMHLGFQDVAATSFDSVTSHVHWVYCAYLLLNAELPGLTGKSLTERQRYVMRALEHKEKANLLQTLTQINGPAKQKAEIKEALAA